MRETCSCELRNRQWDPLSGRCLSCHLYFYDERREKIRADKLRAEGSALAGVIPPEVLTSDNLTAEHYLKKTWSIVADKMGTHWHATVRVGQEGSRGLCGKLQFDLSDVEDLRDRLHDVADRLGDNAVVMTMEELDRRDIVFRYGTTEAFKAELCAAISSLVRRGTRELLLERLQWAFGVRVDLAKVNG